MVEPAITRLLVERDDVVFVLCGPGEFVDIFNTVRRMKKLIHVPRMAYEAFARAASMADVAIAPLGQTAFNGNKSEIRLIEAGAWGVPVVASAVAPYRRFESGQGACLLVEGNDVNGWYAALTRLLDDAEMRRTMGFIARITVATRYHLPAVNSARAELWASV
jgi:glycosyltransferase involved in cell wall biosynthesis